MKDPPKYTIYYCRECGWHTPLFKLRHIRKNECDNCGDHGVSFMNYDEHEINQVKNELYIREEKKT